MSNGYITSDGERFWNPCAITSCSCRYNLTKGGAVTFGHPQEYPAMTDRSNIESRNDIRHRFDFHPATTPEKKGEHGSARNAVKSAALAVDRLLPNGREKQLALTKLEEAMFWANAGIAREVPKPTIIGFDLAVPPTQATRISHPQGWHYADEICFTPLSQSTRDCRRKADQNTMQEWWPK